GATARRRRSRSFSARRTIAVEGGHINIDPAGDRGGARSIPCHGAGARRSVRVCGDSRPRRIAHQGRVRSDRVTPGHGDAVMTRRNEQTVTTAVPENDYVLRFTGYSWSVRRSNGSGAFFSVEEGER